MKKNRNFPLFSFSFPCLFFLLSKAASPALTPQRQLFLIIHFHSRTVLSFWAKMAFVVVCRAGVKKTIPLREGKGGRICEQGATFSWETARAVVWWVFSPPVCLSVSLSAPSFSQGNIYWGGINKSNLGLSTYHAEGFLA